MSKEDLTRLGKYGAQNTSSFNFPPQSTDGDDASELPLEVEVLSHVYEKDLPGGEDCGMFQDTLTLLVRNLNIPMANTLRRLMISEVPVMAFDSVVIEENEGVVFDESLSHRIGLVPIQCDPDHFQFIKDIALYDSPQASADHFLKFTLNIVAENELTPVYSGDLKWTPLPGQEHLHSLNIKPVNEKILLCKLAKGRRLKLSAYAVKGVGLNHAKWSPVSCSTYKLRPHVEIKKDFGDVTPGIAARIAKICPVNVFDIEESGKLRVVDADACTGCRECIREFTDEEAPVVISRNKRELIFTIESLGQMSARTIIKTALRDFADHCENLSALVERCR
mmetsp:Transcript_20034/g.31389  ORF Transcript_20034/g.31389 Transcript_20034/m.31389 type:complete len:336 (-) Transcript_20034:19-1026(-)